MQRRLFILSVFLLIISVFIILILKDKNQDSFFIELDHLRKYQLDSITNNPDYDSLTNQMILWQKDFLSSFDIHENQFKSKLEVDENKLNDVLETFMFHLNKGDTLYYKPCDKNIESRNEYIKALDIAKATNKKQLICEAVKRILDIDRYSYLMNDLSSDYFLDIYRKNAYDSIEKTYLKYYELSLSFKNTRFKKWDKKIEDDLLSFAYNSNLHILNGRIFQLVASYYHIKDENKKAISYLEKALENINKIEHGYGNIVRNIIMISLTRYHWLDGSIDKAEKFYEKIDTTNINKIISGHKYYKFYYRYELDKLKGDKHSALINLEDHVSMIEILKPCNNENLASEANSKYQSKEKDKLLKTEKKRIRYLIFGGISLILLLSSIGYLIVKNSRRKRLLALQEKELETQKNITFLKEQEITTINAMVEGQEKERKRVAEDLHDNLGSVIATLKLHFDNLRINREKKKIDQETLFDKTEKLIDEAYKKVRSIAHAKNAGVIANQGLLVAVQMMAEKISSANKIQIEVIDYGLEKPIENSLEISLFRIIQELTTNILKHSEANQATINISQDQDDITILVEDNGIGMNTSEIDHKKGMGLHSIKTRVEHLEGSFTIDSTPNKGTTIIINIPT